MSLTERVASLSPEELAQEYITAVTALKKQDVDLTNLAERNEELRVQNDWLKRQLFGKKSERVLPSDHSARQLTLGEGYEPEDTPPPKTTTVQSYERSHRNDEVQFAEDESRLKFDKTVPVEVVREVLGQFEGTLLTDAYKVYEVFAQLHDEVTRAQCWAHTRRKFFDAKEYQPELSEKALAIIRQLYQIEEEHGPKGRQKHARPLIDDFFDWLEKTAFEHTLLPSSPFLKATSYALNNERALRVFLDNPKVALDTNHVERDNRLNAMGRKNYMFHWTEVGAKYAAILYSLIATCRHQKIDTYTYLVDVLQRVQTHPMHEIHLLTPANWKENFQDTPLVSDLEHVVR